MADFQISKAPSPAPGPEPLLLTPPEAARLLAVSPRTLWGLTNAGEISCVKIGRLVRYDPADLRAFVAARRAPP